MKNKIILIFAILFSASFVDAKSVRIVATIENLDFVDIHEGLIEIVDSVKKTRKTYKFYIEDITGGDSFYLDAHKTVLMELSSHLSSILGNKFKLPNVKGKTYEFSDLILLIEENFIFSDFKLTLSDAGFKTKKLFSHTMYFYKQE